MNIDDGSGNGFKARVDSKLRMHTHSVSETESLHALETGVAFNINTGLISVTGNATLIYLKNLEDQDIVIESIAIGSFEGITHSDDPYLKIIKNPLSGDLITDASPVAMNENRNFGSSRELSADVFKGKVSGTITGGSDVAFLQASGGGRGFYPINLILPKGSSVAIDLIANVTSGSANWYCALICHLKDVNS